MVGSDLIGSLIGGGRRGAGSWVGGWLGEGVMNIGCLWFREVGVDVGGCGSKFLSSSVLTKTYKIKQHG